MEAPHLPAGPVETLPTGRTNVKTLKAPRPINHRSPPPRRHTRCSASHGGFSDPADPALGHERARLFRAGIVVVASRATCRQPHSHRRAGPILGQTGYWCTRPPRTTVQRTPRVWRGCHRAGRAEPKRTGTGSGANGAPAQDSPVVQSSAQPGTWCRPTGSGFSGLACSQAFLLGESLKPMSDRRH